ncbi:hypothetical protein [Lactococcus lactis]|uniref:hypothetical protein n=1 Tax=Lactococcus lactis TaxID=1358 RepID=UPI00071C3EAF|nr:hypothetical protein [Lactococcus lactis]KST91961.1 hypothetical protein KF134_1017 [Lactococcus lactis subsp. lactis]KSU15071.1 hypothetical protein LMG9446_0834 [Lactococcus lactis subsp. lactis]MCT0054050.1 hypothetical protein [Lactococcus lactis subsp. lactis]MDG4955179.1 hypothetical protein [Lactococcus lactis]PFG85088.1 hypothetical protein BW151_01650 [Lactococcus lactis]
MKYKLNQEFRLRKTDKAIFNFSKTELTQFNESGFEILVEALEIGDREWTEEETNFIERLVKENIIEEC